MDRAGTEFLTDMDSEKKEQQEKDTDTTTAKTQSEHIPGISNLTSTLETPGYGKCVGFRFKTTKQVYPKFSRIDSKSIRRI